MPSDWLIHACLSYLAYRLGVWVGRRQVWLEAQLAAASDAQARARLEAARHRLGL